MKQNHAKIRWLIPMCVPLALGTLGMGSLVVRGLTTEPPPWIVSSRYAGKQNPLPRTDASIAAGAKVYTAQCVACHGKTGAGDGIRSGELDPRPHDLSDPRMWLLSDGELFYMVRKGRRPMAAFDKVLSDDEIWHAVNYIRSLAPRPKVLGARFDVGSQPRAAMARVITQATKLAEAMSSGDSDTCQQVARELAEAAGALAEIDLSSQGKEIARLWKSTASGLRSRAARIASAADPQARASAFVKFNMTLIGAMRSFGGVENGLVYQFEIPSPSDAKETWTWIQLQSDPRVPFSVTDGTQPHVVFAYGPQTQAGN